MIDLRQPHVNIVFHKTAYHARQIIYLPRSSSIIFIDFSFSLILCATTGLARISLLTGQSLYNSSGKSLNESPNM